MPSRYLPQPSKRTPPAQLAFPELLPSHACLPRRIIDAVRALISGLRRTIVTPCTSVVRRNHPSAAVRRRRRRGPRQIAILLEQLAPLRFEDAQIAMELAAALKRPLRSPARSLRQLAWERPGFRQSILYAIAREILIVHKRSPQSSAVEILEMARQALVGAAADADLRAQKAARGHRPRSAMRKHWVARSRRAAARRQELEAAIQQMAALVPELPWRP